MNLKESRISFLLLFSLCLLLLAFIVLFAWGFLYYRAAAETVKSKPEIVRNDSITIAMQVSDSLQKIYNTNWLQLNNQLDLAKSKTDAIQGNLDLKYNEFEQIRTEIAAILEKNKTPGRAEPARLKLLELQLRLEEWRKNYNDVAAENARLAALLKQLTNTDNSGRSVPGYTPPAHVKEPAQRLPAIQVKAWQLRVEEEQDNMALKGSLDIINNQDDPNMEMYVVILQPDGRLLKQSGWDSGSFETKDGTKIYSCKLRFDCAKGENKSLHFSVPSGNFQKGTYSIQVYHHGVIVARGNKSLT